MTKSKCAELKGNYAQVTNRGWGGTRRGVGVGRHPEQEWRGGGRGRGGVKRVRGKGNVISGSITRLP